PDHARQCGGDRRLGAGGGCPLDPRGDGGLSHAARPAGTAPRPAGGRIAAASGGAGAAARSRCGLASAHLVTAGGRVCEASRRLDGAHAPPCCPLWNRMMAWLRSALFNLLFFGITAAMAVASLPLLLAPRR